MIQTLRIRGRIGILALGCILVGCSSGVGEITAVRNKAPMPPEAQKKMADAFAANNQKVANEQAQWRVDHPAEAAKMDADRARDGMGPVGK